MGSQIDIEGFQLPPEVSRQRYLNSWLKQKPSSALKKMDRGDPLDPNSKEIRANDRKLAPIEIFNAVIDDYKLATQKGVRAGLEGRWRHWERYQRHRDTLARVIQELGWQPAFHISDREYNRRIIELIRRERPRDLASLQRLFQLGMASWEQGGLCFGYPPGFKETWQEYTAEEMVKACKKHDVAHWAECNGTARGVMALITSALSVYQGDHPEIAWWLIKELPNSPRGHSFIALHQNDNTLALDPSRYGFSLLSSSVYLKHDPYRASIATYYSNLARVPTMGENYAEMEKLYRKSVAISPQYDLGWNNLGWVTLKQGRHQEARKYFLRALTINPKNYLAQINLSNLKEDKK